MKSLFNNGDPVGEGLYYDKNGLLERKEIIRFKKIKTTLYHPNGHKRMKGYAKLIDMWDRYQFYFYGRWEYFDEKGKLLKYCYFNKGVMGKTEYLDKGNKTSDSLINVLNSIDKNFFERNASLINAINKNIPDPAVTEKCRSLLLQQDSNSFKLIGNYLLTPPYPSAKIAGESSLIPFSILSYALVQVKEQYSEIFRNAVADGEMPGKTFAFHKDKLKIAKGGKQFHGTQFYFDQKKGLVYLAV